MNFFIIHSLYIHFIYASMYTRYNTVGRRAKSARKLSRSYAWKFQNNLNVIWKRSFKKIFANFILIQKNVKRQKIHFYSRKMKKAFINISQWHKSNTKSSIISFESFSYMHSQIINEVFYLISCFRFTFFSPKVMTTTNSVFPCQLYSHDELWSKWSKI